MAPIFYRTHTHDLGYVISSYIVRNEKWIEIGRMTPTKAPQAFYPVTTPNLILTNNDFFITRCVYDTLSKNETTFTGFTF